MKLEFDVGSCVRATSKFSECTKCVDVCPVSTIEIVDNIPAFTPSACINCGGCVGVCPTESFSLNDFSSINFFFEFLESQNSHLSCKSELPCLSILSIEHLIALALASDELLSMDVEGCQCGGDSDKLTLQINANIEEANFILESISDKQIEIKSVEIEVNEE
jgi:ferredoxin